MNIKCYICNHKMEEKIISISTGWGDCKMTINDVSAYICQGCGEMVLDSKEVLMLQELSKGLKIKDK